LPLAKICPERANHTFPGTFAFMSKRKFLSHNFGSRCARKPIKGSKDSDDSLVSKKILSYKNEKPQPQTREYKTSATKAQKHAPILTSPTTNPKHKMKNFYN